MRRIRRSDERGHARHGWLDSRHSFSFGDWYDPRHLGFSVLRVLNDDRVTPGAGFPTHGHRDMEIVTYVLDGALQHADSTGTGSTIRPGDVQRMTAGRGISHSEFNASPTDPLHFLQIWILPGAPGLPPSYEEKRFDEGERRGRLRLVASPDAAAGSVTIHQDARIYAGLFAAGERATLPLAAGRKAYVHVATGRARVDDAVLETGDAVEVSDEAQVTIEGIDGGEVLAFDLP
jgi:quercetin 2,3-dioxygenase